MSKKKIETFEMLRELLMTMQELAVDESKLINCDQTQKMRISKVIDSNHYIVQYNGSKEYKAFSRFEHKVGELVYVTICCGNMNDLIIN